MLEENENRHNTLQEPQIRAQEGVPPHNHPYCISQLVRIQILTGIASPDEYFFERTINLKQYFIFKCGNCFLKEKNNFKVSGFEWFLL